MVTVAPARNVAPFAGDVMLTVGSWLGAVQFSVIAVEVAVIPRLFVARAVRVCVPWATFENVTEYGRRVAVPMRVAPSKKSTDVIHPSRSIASAARVTLAGGENVVQLSGCVITTNGGAPNQIETGSDVVTAFWVSV